MQKKYSKKPTNTFREKVYNVVSKIPKGKVLSYGEVARLAGSPKAARAVGTLMNKNPYPKDKVPCHRVVKADMSVGKYAKGKNLKIKLLTAEGVNIEKGKIIK